MGTRISFVMMLFIGSMPFAIFNLIPFISGWTPQPRHMAASIAASLILLLTGFIMAWKKQRFFLRWYSAYWLSGAVLLSLAVLTDINERFHSCSFFPPGSYMPRRCMGCRASSACRLIRHFFRCWP